uniref:RNase H type-1 domain-containing protein n=1 Tax=Globisporangium ultimum (strain ATCC 200006 / CBS 805.95 / DAOM BR144) TaxID=431595 RepID=K3WC14_GLOUD
MDCVKRKNKAINQLMSPHLFHKPSCRARLRALYTKTQRIARGIRVLSWRHHARGNNKLADLTANQATSSQYTTLTDRLEGAEIYQHLDNDVSHHRFTHIQTPGRSRGFDTSMDARNLQTYLDNSVGEMLVALRRRRESSTSYQRTLC